MGRPLGRGDESYCDRSLARALLPVVEALTDRPVVLFGHSLGALIAYELAIACGEPACPRPRTCSSRGVMHRTSGQDRRTWDLSDDALIAVLRDLGGTPREVLGDPGLLAMLATGLRADLEMNERYEYTAEDPLATPITAFAPSGDVRAALDEVAAWAAHTSRRFTLVPLEGGHFALLAQPRLLTDRMLC